MSRNTAITRGFLLGLAATALLLTQGCGGKSLPEGFAPAYGTVTLDGKPVQDAQVIFATPHGESYGRTDENGYYQMERTRSLTGAGIGPATVTITTTSVFSGMETEGLEIDPISGDPKRKETIPEKYKDGIQIEVTPDGAPYDFELTSAEEPGQATAQAQ